MSADESTAQSVMHGITGSIFAWDSSGSGIFGDLSSCSMGMPVFNSNAMYDHYIGFGTYQNSTVDWTYQRKSDRETESIFVKRII